MQLPVPGESPEWAVEPGEKGDACLLCRGRVRAGKGRRLVRPPATVRGGDTDHRVRPVRTRACP